MAYQTVLKIHKASFQQGKTTIRSQKELREDGSLKGDTIIGNKGIDMTLTAQAEGYVIKTESYVTPEGWAALRIYTEEV